MHHGGTTNNPDDSTIPYGASKIQGCNATSIFMDNPSGSRIVFGVNHGGS